MALGTALLSVSDKTGLVAFARALASRGCTILSSGGTAKSLQAEGITVETVEEYTGSPEVMGGRVKTLHPRVHGGILSRGEMDRSDLARLGGREIDIVVVNLYPFEKTAANPASSFAEVVENIDIGGPSMVRSAAKNHARVAVICDPADYPRVLSDIDANGSVSTGLRAELAAKAFAHTAGYDTAIAAYLSSRPSADATTKPEAAAFPRYFGMALEQAYPLRYGENPHQAASFYVERHAEAGTLARAESLGTGAKELSFNNLVDADAALEAVREFDRSAAVVVKHTNPCGVAIADSIEAAYVAARDADALSAFGGIVALNRDVDDALAKKLVETFLECVIAPGYSASALEILRGKKNLRVLSVGTMRPANVGGQMVKRVDGGLLVQTRDNTGPGEVTGGKIVTKRQPTAEEMRDLEFAWRVCKHVKSNAIVLASNEVTVGVGAGQMSRVISVQIAGEKAGEKARGSVLASDAFFPFPDGLEAAAKVGVTAVAQPGGSVKDADVIAAADKAGLAMIFTGVRHFRH